MKTFQDSTPFCPYNNVRLLPKYLTSSPKLYKSNKEWDKEGDGILVPLIVTYKSYLYLTKEYF